MTYYLGLGDTLPTPQPLDFCRHGLAGMCVEPPVLQTSVTKLKCGHQWLCYDTEFDRNDDLVTTAIVPSATTACSYFLVPKGIRKHPLGPQ